MIQIKKTILTLALLLTAATGAWAQSAVASIGSENYTTLQDAFTAAETGQTIKLLSDVTQTGGVGKSDGKAVTFDLNGHIYTCTDDYSVMATYNSQITIIDSSTGTPGGIKSELALVGQGNGKIIIKAGRYNIGNLSAKVLLLEAFPNWCVEMYSGYTLQDITPADAQGFCVGVVAPASSALEVAWTAASKTGTFTMPGGNVVLHVEYEPEFTATFKAANALTIEAGKATVSVTENGQTVTTATLADGKLSPLYQGQTVILKASEGYKFRKVEAKKGEATTSSQLSAVTTDDQGKVVCAAGHLHDAKEAVPDGCTAVGILGKVTETGHGLILALQDATSQNWNTINGWTSVTTYAGTTLKLLPDDAARGSLTSYTTLGETAVSDWAVAQKSDYDAIFTNLGSTTSNSDGTTYDANVNAYITTGVGGTAISGYYWSATGVGSSDPWVFYSTYWYCNVETDSFSVRPVLGF